MKFGLSSTIILFLVFSVSLGAPQSSSAQSGGPKFQVDPTFPGPLPENWAVREARAQQFSKSLTPRQREVLQLLAEGRPMKEIADILKVSEKTIMFHKYHMMESFNLKSNAELVLFALKNGLISA